MVVPVPVAASDTTVDIEISAPCSSTFFSFSVNCPTLLTGFPASNVGVSAADVCGDPFTTNIYHVGVNTLGIPNRPVSQGGPLAATPDTQMGIHDWVFTDQYGVTPVPTGWYHIQNLIGGVITSQAIQVSSDGIVVSISNCAASCSNNIFISGLQNACDTFCDGTNRTIPTARQTTTCDTYLTLGIGDVFTGAAITQGWYAYAATSTNTATGPFRIMQIGPNNEVLSIKQCSGANCIAV